MASGRGSRHSVSWVCPAHSDFQTVNTKSMRALTKRPETLDKLGIHWLLMNDILRLSWEKTLCWTRQGPMP